MPTEEETITNDYRLENAVARERMRIKDAKLIDEARARLQLEEVQQMKRNIQELEREYIMQSSSGVLNKSVSMAKQEVETENEKLREEIDKLIKKERNAKAKEPIVLNVKEMYEELAKYKKKSEMLENEMKEFKNEFEEQIEEQNRITEIWKQRTSDVCEVIAVIDEGEFRDAVDENLDDYVNDNEEQEEKFAKAMEKATEKLYEFVQKQSEAKDFIESLKSTIEHMKREADQHKEDVQKTLQTTLGAVQKEATQLTKDLKIRTEQFNEANRNVEILRSALAGQDEKANRLITQLQKDLMKEQQKRQSDNADGTPSATVILDTGDEKTDALSFELSKTTAKFRAAETKIRALEKDLDIAREQRENLIAQVRQNNAGEATVSSPKSSESKQLTMLRAEKAVLTRQLSEAKAHLNNQHKQNQSVINHNATTSMVHSAVPRVSGGTDSDRKDLAQLRVQLRKSETEAKELKRRLEISERRAASLYISISSDRNK